MKYSKEVEEKLGRAVVRELRRLVSKGHIGKNQVKEMSYQHNMDVNMIYNDSHDKEENIVTTMEGMLEGWYESTVCSLSQSGAQSKLLEILRESSCSNLVVEGIGKLCQAPGGGAESSGENKGNLRGKNIDLSVCIYIIISQVIFPPCLLTIL